MIHQPSDPRLSRKLNDEQVAWLSGYGKERDLETGEYLFKERDYVDSFYVVLEGEIRILRVGSDGAEVTINIHKPGGFVGQLAALAGRTTGARARAVVPSRVLEITADAFRDVAAADPEVADIFISTLARRMRFTRPGCVSRIRWPLWASSPPASPTSSTTPPPPPAAPPIPCVRRT
jgi:CRP/FNR family transcriptional regulator